MFEFLLKKPLIRRTQKFIDNLTSKVNVFLHEELPIPSIWSMKRMAPTVAKINAFEESMAKLSDEQLRAKTDEFKARYQKDIAHDKESYEQLLSEYNKALSQEEKEELSLQLDSIEGDFKKAKKRVLDEILPEAFAVVREVGKRTILMRHFDVQMIGGMVLHEGDIAEMTTGEGKTLVATLPAYLNALTGEGVHVVTVNDYLAKRDREWMGPIYEFLGLTLGVIQHDMSPHERQQSYGCDITYGTNNEFGFDYLRDNMVIDKQDMVQRGHHFAIVDEVDSILIDEARTPLIISGPAEESTDKYYRASEISKKLQGRRITEKDEVEAKYQGKNLAEGVDYLADEKAKSIALTEAGEEKAAQLFGVANLHEMETIEYRHHILQSLKAKEFFKNDVDYVVRDGEVIIVDEFTGRMMPGRRWSDGLHQAVEAREGIKIERENQTLATITFQNYFRLYEKLSGMTGTAETEATEFKQIYDLDCVVVPTNKKLQRKNYPDAIYKTQDEKLKAVVEEINQCYDKGQPTLVGTISIEKSERLSRMLTQRGIKHQVLNAKYHEREAQIIAQAGRLKGVTIATNMAGRGTDIVLGGNAEFLAKSLAAEKSTDQEKEDLEQKEILIKKFLEQFRQQVKEEHEKVVASGGLHVIGTERHESRRIDNQLRGRQGRQGDPGSSRFYVSLQDDLMRLFASDRMIGLMDKLGMDEGQALEHPLLSRALENAQRRVESYNFEIRKHLLEFDNVMNRQREVIYSLRRSALEGQNVKEFVLDAIDQLVKDLVAAHLSESARKSSSEEAIESSGPDIKGLLVYLKTKFGYELDMPEEKLADMEAQQISEIISEGLRKVYEQKERDFGIEQLRRLERMVLLNTIDSKWKDHLYAMDQMKEGINWRSYAQRDPLTEYKREGFEMFQMMYVSIHDDVVQILFKIQRTSPSQAPARGVFSSLPQKLIHDEVSGLSQVMARHPAAMPAKDVEPPAQPKLTPQRNAEAKVGRNDPCPCGSGKKYKKCCGQ